MAIVRLMSLAMVLSACTSASPIPQPNAESVTVVNQGGDLEGHTPRGFPGMGTGLFAGDNLNPAFPDGDGVQIFLTFEVPGSREEPTSVVLASDALEVRGTPFADLGRLTVQAVTYDSFGPDLFDLPGDSDPVGCTRTGSTGLACDLTEIAGPALSDGRTLLQVRIRFESVADSDGEPDLAMFFRTDSNTNEPGIFELTIDR